MTATRATGIDLELGRSFEALHSPLKNHHPNRAIALRSEPLRLGVKHRVALPLRVAGLEEQPAPRDLYGRGFDALNSFAISRRHDATQRETVT